MHGITSLDAGQASTEAVARWARSRWGIENKIHYVRDSSSAKTISTPTSAHPPTPRATIRNLALGLIRLAGITEIKRALERIAADRTRIVPILAASRP